MRVIYKRFSSIPISSRVKWFYSFILFVVGAAMLARPSSQLNYSISNLITIDIEIIALVFWLMIPVLYATHALINNLFSVILPMSPLVAYTLLLMQQMNNTNASLVHFAMALITLVAIVLTYYLAEEVEEQKKIINALKASRSVDGD